MDIDGFPSKERKIKKYNRPNPSGALMPLCMENNPKMLRHMLFLIILSEMGTNQPEIYILMARCILIGVWREIPFILRR